MLASNREDLTLLIICFKIFCQPKVSIKDASAEKNHENTARTH